MSSLRLDQVVLSSFHESFRNREIMSGSIDISGSVGAGATANFDYTFTITRNNSIAEVYYQKTGDSKRKADSGIELYDFGGSGNPTILITYPTATTIRVRISVFNPSGGSISLTAQTYNLSLYIFDTPFSL